MQAFLQIVTSIAGAAIIGIQLHNPTLAFGIWLITYSIMPFVPRGK